MSYMSTARDIEIYRKVESLARDIYAQHGTITRRAAWQRASYFYDVDADDMEDIADELNTGSEYAAHGDLNVT